MLPDAFKPVAHAVRSALGTHGVAGRLNDAPHESAGLSLYRRRDIENLVARLESDGHKVEPIDWSTGKGFADGFVDLPPHASPSHLRLRVAGYDCTSIGIIIHARA
jgi:hypothetical protein